MIKINGIKSPKAYRVIKPFGNFTYGMILNRVTEYTDDGIYKMNKTSKDLYQCDQKPHYVLKARKAKDAFIQGKLELVYEDDIAAYKARFSKQNFIVVKPFDNLNVGDILKYNFGSDRYEFKNVSTSYSKQNSEYTWDTNKMFSAKSSYIERKCNEGFLKLENTSHKEILDQVRHFLNTQIIEYNVKIADIKNKDINIMQKAEMETVLTNLRILCLAIKGILDEKTKVNHNGKIVDNE